MYPDQWATTTAEAIRGSRTMTKFGAQVSKPVVLEEYGAQGANTTAVEQQWQAVVVEDTGIAMIVSGSPERRCQAARALRTAIRSRMGQPRIKHSCWIMPSCSLQTHQALRFQANTLSLFIRGCACE
jgi:hypothetical protein